MQNYELPEHHSGDTYEGVSFEMLKNEVPLVLTGASISFQFRETTENSGSGEYIRTLAANDVIRVRLLRLSGNTNIKTIPEGCNLLIEQL